VTTLNGSLKFPVCFLRGVSGTVEGNNGPDMVRETIKRVDKCNHIFGLVSVVLTAVNATSLPQVCGCASLFYSCGAFCSPPQKKSSVMKKDLRGGWGGVFSRRQQQPNRNQNENTIQRVR
jgi:hypothetical protein